MQAIQAIDAESLQAQPDLLAGEATNTDAPLNELLDATSGDATAATTLPQAIVATPVLNNIEELHQVVTEVQAVVEQPETTIEPQVAIAATPQAVPVETQGQIETVNEGEIVAESLTDTTEVVLGEVVLTEVKPGQDVLAEAKTGEDVLAEVKTAEAKTGEDVLAEVKTAEVKPGQDELAEVKTGEVKPGPDELGQVARTLRQNTAELVEAKPIDAPKTNEPVALKPQTINTTKATVEIQPEVIAKPTEQVEPAVPALRDESQPIQIQAKAAKAEATQATATTASTAEGTDRFADTLESQVGEDSSQAFTPNPKQTAVIKEAKATVEAVTQPQADTDTSDPARIVPLAQGQTSQVDFAPAPAAAPVFNTAATPVSNQISEALPTIAKAGDRVVIRLNPPELGQVKITFTADGKELRAVVEVDNARALAELQRETPSLVSRLASDGIQLKRMDFVLNETSSQTDAGSGESQGWQLNSGANWQRQGQGGRTGAEAEQFTSEDSQEMDDLSQAYDSDGELASSVSDQSINVWI